jgi:hypothetical protein
MDSVTTTMKAQGIRSITMRPEWQDGGFTVFLNCGGAPGAGETVEAALADALAVNAEWLDKRVLA